MRLIFAVLDVSFNSGHYTVIIERQFCTLIVYKGDDDDNDKSYND